MVEVEYLLKLKLPKDKRWERDAMSAKDNDYSHSRIDFYDDDPNLLIRFKKAPRLTMIKNHYIRIRDYHQYTATQVLTEAYANEWGRHAETLILKFWKSKKLPFGHTIPILRNFDRRNSDVRKVRPS